MPRADKKVTKKKTSPAEIAAHYRKLIDDGSLEPGANMPSYQDVIKAFETSPSTVNAAYRLLKTEGLIKTNPGVGTIVAEQSDVALTGAARLRRIKRTGEPYAPGETVTKHWVGLASAGDPKIAELLDVEPHDEIVIRRKVHRRPGRPATLDIACIHTRALSDVPELLQEQPFERWWQEIYTERTGREVTRSPERRTARLISNDELAALGIELPAHVAAAVLVVVNVFHDEDGPLEVWEDVYPPGAWQMDEEQE